MRGKIRIIVQNERIKYDFTLNRNLTILRGDSATGKTTLIDMIRDYRNLGEESGVELFCEKNCAVVEGNDWEEQVSRINQSIVFVDEGNRFVSSREFSVRIQNTDNYYVLVTREGLPALPYSIDEIYGIRSGGKYGGLHQVYHEWYHIYGGRQRKTETHPSKIITEDSNAGFQFFKAIGETKNISCISAMGKSNICAELLNCAEESVVVVADGAAFGSEMEKVCRVIEKRQDVMLFLPESFEWLILMSDVLNDKEIRQMSENWSAWIESRDYFSWERFFTDLLVEKSQDSFLKYNKRKLNPAYLGEKIKEKILEKIQWWNEES